MSNNNLNELVRFVKQRDLIRRARLAGTPPPWTRDAILSKFRFCNVRRGDDRVSLWLKQNVLTRKNVEYDLKSFLMFSALCRWVNWPPTIQAILDARLYPRKRPNWAKIGAVIDRIEGKRFTGAYLIRAPSGARARLKKGAFVATHVIEKSLGSKIKPLLALFRSGAATCDAAWKLLLACENEGSFMAGQIVADWAYTPLLANAPDLYTWAAQGPGSIRGYNRVLGRPLKTRVPKWEWDENIVKWRRAIVDELGPEFEDLDAHSVNNCLCEFDKYMRVKNGEGRPRALYKPHAY